MGLIQEISAGINSKLYDQSTPKIPTYHPKARPIYIPSTDGPKLWCKKSTSNSIGYFTANNRQTRAHDPKIVGSFLYYARAVDCTMLPALNTISEQQSNPTNNTEAEITQFLEYAATNPSAIFQYKSSYMILHIYSDASYLSEPLACSFTVEHYYLSSLIANPKKAPNLPPQENVPIHTECKNLKHVVASVSK